MGKGIDSWVSAFGSMQFKWATAYHNVEHRIDVTLVGLEILRGTHIREGGVSPEDWLHFPISLLCHPGDWRASYPGFFGKVVYPDIKTGLSHLDLTQDGQQIIANL